ncbi:MAG: glycosyltransferase family 39 protein [Actinobacteria bacterium]|nr:glycosyltransferase family 39 protein [Actinomycetota bacterium]MBU1944653.1 glycosyltransferase family 39 protein [Actinomycetota bacterium]MBU2689201.1 glycosyltransferase family 39 protein [Actinomycetota bacterium]
MMVALICILAVAGLLRAVSIGHDVTYDEAWNVNSMIDGASGHTADSFFENFYHHPPAYTGLGITLAWIGGTGRQSLAVVMEIVSIAFGLALVLAVYLCGRDWFGARAGLAAAFVLAVMPSARTMDSWIKQESMALFFCTLFLFFFFRRNFLIGGAFLGLALLTKEPAVFVVAALVPFVLLFRRPGMIRGLGISLGLGALLSAWWYVFLSRSGGKFLDFFLGEGGEAYVWRGCWYYYLGRIPQDLGFLSMLLLALALLLLVLRFRALSQEEGGTSGYSRRDMLVFLFLWIVAVYLVISISYGKPPWMTYMALAPVALVSGWGAVEVFRLARERGRVVSVGAVVLLVAALALAFTIVPGSYSTGADWYFERARVDRGIAGYINERGGGGCRVMLYSFDVTPSLMFYLDCYAPESMVAVMGDPAASAARYLDYSVFLVFEDQTSTQAIRDIYVLAPDYVLLFDGPWSTVRQTRNAVQTLKICRQLTLPLTVDGKAVLFDGKELKKAIEREYARIVSGQQEE